MLDKCPNPECGCNQISSEIPENLRCNDKCPEGVCMIHPYKGKHFYNTVGVYAFDRTVFFQCPECKAAWHRFEEGTFWHRQAQEMMERDNLLIFPKEAA